MAHNIPTASDVLEIIDARFSLAGSYLARVCLTTGHSYQAVLAHPAYGNAVHLDSAGAISIAFMGR